MSIDLQGPGHQYITVPQALSLGRFVEAFPTRLGVVVSLGESPLRLYWLNLTKRDSAYCLLVLRSARNSANAHPAAARHLPYRLGLAFDSFPQVKGTLPTSLPCTRAVRLKVGILLVAVVASLVSVYIQ